VGKVLRKLVLLSLAAIAQFSWAHGCNASLAAMAASSEGEPVSLEQQLQDMASLYSLVLDEKVSPDVFQTLLSQLATREGRSEIDLYKRIEFFSASPTERKAQREEREEKKREEQQSLLEGLKPYLSRISREHRSVIEETLIRPGLVYPIITGEVDFRFQGTHRFEVENEGDPGAMIGATRESSFGPGDDFAIGQVPVTQLLYFLAALGRNEVEPTPSDFQVGEGSVALHLGDEVYHLKPNHPVEQVSYNEAWAHARRVSELTGLRYEIPSELKWEFANRAGSKDKFHFGDEITLVSRYAWSHENAGLQTHAVGLLLPNAFHLYDTHGNVSEWTSSRVESEFVLRGGSWFHNPIALRSAARGLAKPGMRNYTLGFRLERQGDGYTRPADIFTLGAREAKPGSEKGGSE
jgi:hypothetical protein